MCQVRKGTVEMEIQTLLNSLTTGGFVVSPHGESGISVSPAETLSDAQRQAIREHKTTLRLLACIPDEYGKAEREAIQFADSDSVEADMALILARFELQEIIEPPEACECGSLVFRWDLEGERYCMVCDPSQAASLKRSAKLLQIAKSIRNKYADSVKRKSPECLHHPSDSNPTPFGIERT